MLNVDYKIATKVIANRVKHVITKIIHNSQTGFIKGRYLGENIRLLFEIIDNAEEENKPGLIFFSDFAKAFDSIDHTCWIKRIIEADNDSILNRIYIYNLRAFGGNLLFECNISENDICKFTQNIFLKDVLSAWCKCTANVKLQT